MTMNFDVVQAVGAAVTAVGVFLAWRELRQSRQQAQTDFEDEFPREYRQLAQKLPVRALLGQPLDSREAEEAEPSFFQYVDLCNEQVFLRQNGRVSQRTWRSWRGGIKSNLELPAFRTAWEKFKKETRSFAELRKLEESNFNEDPIAWGSQHVMVKPDDPETEKTSLEKAA
jgi:hypothetical protein